MTAERSPSAAKERAAGSSTRLVMFAAYLMALSPGVMLGWGYSLGIAAGLGIAYGLWWVNSGR